MEEILDPYYITEEEKEEIFQTLGEASVIYKDGLYIDVIISYRHGLLVPFAYHIRQVYFNYKVLSSQIIESIFAVAMFNCDNKYCYLYHTGELLKLGFSEQDIMNLTDHFNLPKDFVDRVKWEEVLKLTHFMFRSKDKFTFETTKAIRSILSNEEYDHFVQVLALANIIFQMLVAFDKELNIENEPQYKRVDSNDFLQHVKDFIDYCEWHDDRGEKRSFLTICTYCKDVKGLNGEWLRIERVLKSDVLDANTEFSHGICGKCFDRAMSRV